MVQSLQIFFKPHQHDVVLMILASKRRRFSEYKKILFPPLANPPSRPPVLAPAPAAHCRRQPSLHIYIYIYIGTEINRNSFSFHFFGLLFPFLFSVIDLLLLFSALFLFQDPNFYSLRLNYFSLLRSKHYSLRPKSRSVDVVEISG